MELEQLELGFAPKVIDYLNDVFEEKSKDFKEAFVQAVAAVKSMQSEEQTTPTEHIAVQFSETDYYFGKAVFKISFYEPKQIFHQVFQEFSVETPWILEPLTEFSTAVREYQISKEKTEEWYQLELRKLLHILLMTASSYFKYGIRECCEDGCVDQLFHVGSLSISFGQQRNWQIPVYQCGAEIDLVSASADIPRKFQVYQNGIYEKKDIKQMDFTGSVFKKCIFTDCNFNQNIWNDVIFIDCEFRNVTFEKDQFFGVTFKSCKMKKATAKDILTEVDEDSMTGLYQGLKFEDCNDGLVAVFEIQGK